MNSHSLHRQRCQESFQSLEKHVRSRAQWWAVRFQSEHLMNRAARDERPVTALQDHSIGAQVEVCVDGKFGYGCTSQIDSEGLQQALERALTLAQYAPHFTLVKFQPELVRPAVTGTYHSQIRKPFETVSPREQFDFLIQITKGLKISPRITRTTANLRLVETETLYFSSSGADLHQSQQLASIDFSATAREGAVTQRRSDGGMFARSFQGGFETIDTPDLQNRIRKVAEQSIELVLAPECPNETLDLILMPDQMALQIHESIGHPLEIDRILGDERNYAGSSFVKLSDFGNLQYGSPIMNITWDPTRTNEFASFGFDDTGAPTSRQHLIQNGILRRGIGGLESQQRAQIPGVATMRASSWARAPIDRMSNINLESGQTSLSEMIQSVERGVLFETNRSWSIDDYRNKFQFGCEYGQLIENGKITGTVRNPNYRGITLPFWHSLQAVGNDDSFEVCGVPFCGKGEPNQTIRVGHASPPCLFQGIEVFGGAA